MGGVYVRCMYATFFHVSIFGTGELLHEWHSVYRHIICFVIIQPREP